MWYKYVIFLSLILAGLFTPSFLELYSQFNLPSWSIPLFALSLYIPFWLAIPSEKPKLLPIFIVGLLSFCYELLSINFGFPYGTFTYGDLMGGLKIFGQVPVTLPLIYIPMVVGALSISKQFNLNQIPTILIASLILSITDILIDPSLTKEGIWTWTGSLLGIDLYNVPIQNFLGWFFTSLISTSILRNLKLSTNFWLTSGLTFTIFFWLGKSIQHEFWISTIAGLCLLSIILKAKYIDISEL